MRSGEADRGRCLMADEDVDLLSLTSCCMPGRERIDQRLREATARQQATYGNPFLERLGGRSIPLWYECRHRMPSRGEGAGRVCGDACRTTNRVRRPLVACHEDVHVTSR